MTTVADWRTESDAKNLYLDGKIEYMKTRLIDNITTKFKNHVREEIYKIRNQEKFTLNLYFKSEDFGVEKFIKYKLGKNDWKTIGDGAKTNLQTIMPGVKISVTNSRLRIQWTDTSI